MVLRVKHLNLSKVINKKTNDKATFQSTKKKISMISVQPKID